MPFLTRTYPTLPRQPPQTTFGIRSRTTPCTDAFPTLVHDNRLTTATLHVEFARINAVFLSSTPFLVRVNLVRSSGIPDFTCPYLVDMRPPNRLTSEIVTEIYETIPLSGFSYLEPRDLVGTSHSPPTRNHFLTTTPRTSIHASHDITLVANVGRPLQTRVQYEQTPCPDLLERLGPNDKHHHRLRSTYSPFTRYHVRRPRFRSVSICHHSTWLRPLRIPVCFLNVHT